MRPVLRAGHWLVVLPLVACHATAQDVNPCSDWQVKFHQVRATWKEGATTRAELERSFGPPTRVQQRPTCSDWNYAAAGCSCWFTICSAETVVSKTLTVGAAAVPVFLKDDPAPMAEAIASLEQRLREAQTEIRRLEEQLTGVAPAPAPAVSLPPPPAARSPAPAKVAGPRQCAALTQQGDRCSRRPEPGSAYCWQHRK
jgi:hypothetical protein